MDKPVIGSITFGPAVQRPGVGAGDGLYMALARAVIARILSADANCDPPHDITLRLEAIIRERDVLKAQLAEQGATRAGVKMCECVGAHTAACQFFRPPPMTTPLRQVAEALARLNEHHTNESCPWRDGVNGGRACADVFAARAALALPAVVAALSPDAAADEVTLLRAVARAAQRVVSADSDILQCEACDDVPCEEHEDEWVDAMPTLRESLAALTASRPAGEGEIG